MGFVTNNERHPHCTLHSQLKQCDKQCTGVHMFCTAEVHISFNYRIAWHTSKFKH